MNTKKPFYRRVAAFVQLHARRRPAHIAVLANSHPITYARLHQDLSAMTEALRTFGLAQGAHVAVGVDDCYTQLLIVFGLEALGIASGSFRPDEGETANLLVASADLTIAQHPNPARPYRRLVEINDDWAKAALDTKVDSQAPIPPAAPDEVAVIIRSSGTTGLPKRMQITHQMLHPRLSPQRIPGIGHGLNKSSRYLATMHFSASSVYGAASNCLRVGATFMFDTDRGALPALLSYHPTNLSVLPYQLRELLGKLPWDPAQGAPILPGLTVVSAGATLPEDLRRFALQRLCGRILEIYGSNEAGYTAVIDETGLGTLIPDVVAEVIDDDGNSVPMGEIGQLRLRSPAMIAGYLDDPATTADKFRGGWFYPGDLAALTETGRLKLAGRPGDVLNLGGIKIAGAVLESLILARVPVLDVALLQRNGVGSSPPVIVCVVVNGQADLPALSTAISAIIGFPLTVRQVPEIPRTEAGKIKRNALRDSLFGTPHPAAPANQPMPARGAPVLHPVA
jgi:acyl-coenzyme A synthetase/AMP-(fatty) acid ligase